MATYTYTAVTSDGRTKSGSIAPTSLYSWVRGVVKSGVREFCAFDADGRAVAWIVDDGTGRRMVFAEDAP